MPRTTSPAIGFTIERASRVTPDLVTAFNELVPQLSPGRMPPDPVELQAILDDERTHMFLAWNRDGAVAGAVSLIFYRVPTGLRARIEDPVVSGSHRGLGLGRALLERALQVARDEKAHVLDLTSHPSRREANRLYLALGFRRWETNVYRKVLDAPSEAAAGEG